MAKFGTNKNYTPERGGLYSFLLWRARVLKHQKLRAAGLIF